jgi:hypothetical protein
MESTDQPCATKARLLREYQETTQIYAGAVSEFDKRLPDAALEVYSELNRMVDAARRLSEDARDRLARHIAEHHC